MAYHESAHAVVAECVGKQISRLQLHTPRATARGSRGVRGECHHHWDNGEGTLDPFSLLREHEADDRCVKMASTAGERIVAERRGWKGYGPSHHASDYTNALRSARRDTLTRDALHDLIRDLDVAERRAEQLLRDPANWRATEAVAQALLHNYTTDAWTTAEGHPVPSEMCGIEGAWVHHLIRQARSAQHEGSDQP